MSCKEVHLTDDGTRFIFPIVDCDGNVVPVNGATIKQVTFMKSDKTNYFIAVCDYFTDGTDGLLEYVTQPDEIDMLGDWQVMAYVETSAGQWHSSIEIFKVVPNLPTLPMA